MHSKQQQQQQVVTTSTTTTTPTLDHCTLAVRLERFERNEPWQILLLLLVFAMLCALTIRDSFRSSLCVHNKLAAVARVSCMRTYGNGGAGARLVCLAVK